jgi:hypothetical protein
MADTDRSITQIADSTRPRVYLEPIQSPTSTAASTAAGSDEVFGVPVFVHPDGTDGPPQWYRVLGVDEFIDCGSTIFIVANLPSLTPDPRCGLANVGYVTVTERTAISFVGLRWGDDLLDEFAVHPPNPISGGIEIKSPSFGAGKACCVVHIFANAKYLGKKHGFDTTKNACVDVNTCSTLIDGGFLGFNVNLSLCYDTKDHPKQLFAELIISLGPFSKTYDAVIQTQ